MKRTAHSYVERHGFAVIPLAPRSKRPIVKGGFKAATKRHSEIERWWDATPAAGIGIATGVESGIVVLDQDPKNGGENSYAYLRRDVGGWKHAPISLTGGGGTHEYFRHPKDGEVPCRTHAGGYQGIDIKGDGGYVVAPPSTHPNGKEYAWDLMFGLDEVEMPEAPPWLLELARQGPDTKGTRYAPEPWDGTLPDRVAYYIATRPTIAKRFKRDPDGLNDLSPSGIDFSLACCLARCGCSPQMIEAAIRASRAKAELQTRPDTYFASTVGKAVAIADKDRARG